MSEPEPNFAEDKDDMDERIETSLNELAGVKAYTLNHDELRGFKAAHYGLRIVHPDFDTVKYRKKLNQLLEQ